MFRIWNWCRFLSLFEKVGNGRYIFSRLEFCRIGIPKFHAKISIELVNMVSTTEHWFFTWIPSFFLLWILLSKNLISTKEHAFWDFNIENINFPYLHMSSGFLIIDFVQNKSIENEKYVIRIDRSLVWTFSM